MDGDHGQAFRSMSQRRIADQREFVAAWKAPGCPKIDQDRFALERREGDGLPIDVLECEVGRRLAHLIWTIRRRCRIVALEVGIEGGGWGPDREEIIEDR